MNATLLLLRHGQASFGADDYDVLSPAGLRQAEVLGEALRPLAPEVRRIVCGTMRRHRQTAEACLAAMGLAVGWEDDPAWNEFDHEAVLLAHDPSFRQTLADQGCAGPADVPGHAFRSLFLAAVERWVGGEHDGDYAESWPAFLARVDAAVERLAASPGPGPVLVFTSGGPIAAACRRPLGVPDARTLELVWRLVNAGTTELVTGRDGTAVRTFNDHAHLSAASPHLVTFR